MEIDEKCQQESRRLAELLFLLIRLSGRNVRSIERQLGVANGALGKVLNGTVRLQVDHILMIAEVLGLTPAQFFHRAYSREERVKPHPLDDLLDESRGHEISEEEETRRAEKLVRRVIRDIFGKAMSDPEPSAEALPAAEAEE
jgi:transcriptional regulator with XRE-family HTH domain